MTSLASPAPPCRVATRANPLPGIALCGLVTAASYAVAAGEQGIAGRAWLEPLVLAILIGTAMRSLWAPDARWQAGIAFSAKHLLEVAVVLLGATVSATTILAVGPALLAGIVGVVAGAIGLSFAIGRLLGLPARMAMLIACGNAICGNSAIAAVAPVIGADSDDVAASIAFTAVLGVAVVLGLPLLGLALGLTGIGYGALAGLTVYAVPQVIAAASPLGAAAVQTGTLVKLVRVLMLGPVCLVLSLAAPMFAVPAAPDSPVIAGPVIAARRRRTRRPDITPIVPWFLIGFLVMVAGRSLGLIPTVAIAPIGRFATLLTVLSMAALGLGVDVRSVAQAGGRVTVAVVLSLAGLIGISLALLVALRLA